MAEPPRRKIMGEKRRSLGRDYHPLCLKCQTCKRQLTAGQHAEHDEKPYCTNCYMLHFGPKMTRPVQSWQRNQRNQT
ncbi:unnamed protein product [Boreogadus saida]